MNNEITKQDFREILSIKGTKYMLETYKVDISILTYVEDIIDWNVLCNIAMLSESEVDLFSNKIDFTQLNLKTYFNLSEKWLLKNNHFVDFEKLSYREDLSLDFIRQFANKFHWNILCLSRIFSESEIEEFIDYVNWSSLTMSHRLSHTFLSKHKDRIDIKYLNLQDVDKESDDFRDKWIEHNAKVEKRLIDRIEEINTVSAMPATMSQDHHDFIMNAIMGHPVVSRDIKLSKVVNRSTGVVEDEILVKGLDNPDLDKINRKIKLSRLNGKSNV